MIVLVLVPHHMQSPSHPTPTIHTFILIMQQLMLLILLLQLRQLLLQRLLQLPNNLLILLLYLIDLNLCKMQHLVLYLHTIASHSELVPSL